ncbi:MAG: hypothetical protein QOD72_3508 [Acidimicrobiaceae bacterium]|nr:hypothetical protein [Acidimicrobiaceae bacterium]
MTDDSVSVESPAFGPLRLENSTDSGSWATLRHQNERVDFDLGPVRRTYDIVAEDYASKFGDDLGDLPFDRSILDQVGQRGVAVDIGCGPGQVAADLADRGVEVAGIDISEGMLRVARRQYPSMRLTVADVRRLPLADTSCAAAVAFYSLQYLPRPAIADTFAELHRVIEVDGLLIIAMHLGTGTVQSPTEWLGHQVESVTGTYYERGELESLIERAGFRVLTTAERGPLPHEHQGDRAYITAAAVTSPPSPRSRA